MSSSIVWTTNIKVAVSFESEWSLTLQPFTHLCTSAPHVDIRHLTVTLFGVRSGILQFNSVSSDTNPAYNSARCVCIHQEPDLDERLETATRNWLKWKQMENSQFHHRNGLWHSLIIQSHLLHLMFQRMIPHCQHCLSLLPAVLPQLQATMLPTYQIKTTCSKY